MNRAPRAGSDDQPATLQRSVGITTYGTSSLGPNQLLSGAPTAGATSGTYTVSYDAAGNVASVQYSLAAHRGARQTEDLSIISYVWDEVGHLASATREDEGCIEVNPNGGCLVTNNFTDTFIYDGAGQRIWRSSNFSGAEAYWAEIFPGLRLNDAAWDALASGSAGTGDFADTDATEGVYLTLGGASYGRAYYDTDIPASMPEVLDDPLHVFLQISDPLGSTSSTVDSVTGELVEQITYQPYGDTETDYRPSRWESFRESYRYTGKEDDYAMGLAYFGARYYMPMLSRWASPDPLAIHGLGGDLNPYAFVSSSPFRYVDPDGLDDGVGSGPPSGDVDFQDHGNNDWSSISPSTGIINFWSYPQNASVPTGSTANEEFQAAVDHLRNQAVSAAAAVWQYWNPFCSSQCAENHVAPMRPPPRSHQRDTELSRWENGSSQKAADGAVAAATMAALPVVGGAEAAEGAGALTEAGAQEIGILRNAAKGSGNFGLGAADAETAGRLGEAWVGDGATLASDGKTLVSADGLRQFRPPSFKPFRGTFQANFEQRFGPQGPWNSNGHLDILFGPPEAP